MSRNGKIHTKKRQFRQMPVLAFLNQRLFLQPLCCDVKPLARRVVQKKAIAEDEEIKTPFAIIKKRSANCI